MLLIGAAAFYGLHVGKTLIFSGSSNQIVAMDEGELPIVTPNGVPLVTSQQVVGNQLGASTQNTNLVETNSRAGNNWINQALVTLEQRQTVSAEVIQLGWVLDSVVETHGSYEQAGSGAKRKFAFNLQGRLADSPTQIMRISDGRSLWTVMQWENLNPLSGATEPKKEVSRVDLRKLRLNTADAPQLRPGQAAANFAATTDWSRFGGLPMLLASINESFDFNAGRRMKLRGEPVIALAGRWNPVRLAELAGNDPETPLPIEPPSHAPHHVVVVLSEETLFPMMVEYRSTKDPLASTQLSDVERLVPSQRPLLKIDFLKVEFNQRLSADRFAYSPPPGTDWQDRTDHELQLAADRREWRTAMATTSRLR